MRFCRDAIVLFLFGIAVTPVYGQATKTKSLPKAFIDGTGQGWKKLGKKDFVNVNCKADTWTWKGDMVHCTGQPVGVIRTIRKYKNFELVVQWRHLKHAGNSGVFVWVPENSLKLLIKSPKNPKPRRLPYGIECQVLDHGYAENWSKKNKGKKPDWFTTHGDVFPVGTSKMKPFAPFASNKRRSFPSKNLSKGVKEWNHYYIRCINGEVRLWVNGEEVSGGTECSPADGYICLESEGSPIEFKHLRIRVLP